MVLRQGLGKAHEHGGNIQGCRRRPVFPLWVSDVEPGSVHDLTCAREHVLGALYWAASHLDLPTLAAGGYDGRASACTPRSSSPQAVRCSGADNRTYNALLRGLRCLGERGFAVVTGRWRALRHLTAGPFIFGWTENAVLIVRCVVCA